MSDLNKDFLSSLGLDAATVAATKEQTVGAGFEVIDSGAYKATVKELFTFKSSGGALMMKITTHLEKEDKDIEEYQTVVNKDGKPNEIGQATFRHIMDAACPADQGSLSNKIEKVLAYKKEVDGTVVKGLDGKPFIALIRAVHEEGAGFSDYNIVEAFARVDGTNSKGEDLLETFKTKIEKTPVMQRKAKGGNTASAATTGATTASGKSVADML